MTLEEVCEPLGWSTSKLSRVETARVVASQEDVIRLLDAYQASSLERRRLLALAQHQTRRPRRRSRPGVHPDGFVSFLDAEAIAESVNQWSLNVVPGLLQTEAYARHLLTSWRLIDPTLTPRVVEDRLATRMKRQELVKSQPPPWYTIILDESVLLRSYGGARIMSEQLDKLLKISEEDNNVSIRIFPLAHGHVLAEESFMLLKLGVGDRRVVYLEHGPNSQVFLDDEPAHLYQQMFHELSKGTLSEAASRDVILKHRNSTLRG